MKREKYIPFDKFFLLEQQITDSAFDKEQSENFKKLFEILEHYFHYEGFNLIQKIKRNYAAFDPDKTHEERLSYSNTSELSALKEAFFKVLERGNYEQIDQSVLEDAFKNSDLLGLQLHINFDDFKEYTVYARGLSKTTEKVRHFYFWKKEVELEYFDRVVIYLQYKDEAYFKSKNINTENLPFNAGCVVLKIFKMVPKNDLETVFPNAVPKMSLKDKLLLWVPAIAGGISLLSTKVIPPLMEIASYESHEILDLNKSKTSLTHGLIALGILGAYVFRQYSNYVSKKIKFSKMLTDSLYFKNLGNNSGVFPALVDASEEEELKETILAYSFLHKSQDPLTAEELDTQIELWFREKLQFDIDFDVNDALDKLKKIGLGIETDGRWTVLPIEKALVRVDEVWDGVFKYNS